MGSLRSGFVVFAGDALVLGPCRGSDALVLGPRRGDGAVALGFGVGTEALAFFVRHLVPPDDDAVAEVHRAVSDFMRSAISLIGAGDAGRSTGT